MVKTAAHVSVWTQDKLPSVWETASVSFEFFFFFFWQKMLQRKIVWCQSRAACITQSTHTVRDPEGNRKNSFFCCSTAVVHTRSPEMLLCWRAYSVFFFFKHLFCDSCARVTTDMKMGSVKKERKRSQAVWISKFVCDSGAFSKSRLWAELSDWSNLWSLLSLHHVCVCCCSFRKPPFRFCFSLSHNWMWTGTRAMNPASKGPRREFFLQQQ